MKKLLFFLFSVHYTCGAFAQTVTLKPTGAGCPNMIFKYSPADNVVSGGTTWYTYNSIPDENGFYLIMKYNPNGGWEVVVPGGFLPFPIYASGYDTSPRPPATGWVVGYIVDQNCPDAPTLEGDIAAYYVKPSGDDSKDGASWATAFATVQKGIDMANDGYSVFVQKGIYNLTAPITMKEDVKIYGSFNGTETALSQRVLGSERSELVRPATATTEFGIITNNFTSITPLTEKAVLDGFVIRGGDTYDGGGIYNNYASPTLRNLTISSNNASRGGGIYNENSSPSLTSMIISGNTAYAGAGISNRDSNPRLTNVILSGNKATDYGGGMVNWDNSSPTVTNVTIAGNSAGDNFSTSNGGGIANFSTGNLEIRNAIIFDNYGGELTTSIGASTNITYSLVKNSAFDLGTYNVYSSGGVFVNPVASSLAPTTAGDYRLLPCSAAINVGTTPSPAVPTDIIGNSRINLYEMGAYEFLGLGTNGSTATAMQQGTVTYKGICNEDIATVTSAATAEGVSGSTTAKVWLEGTQPAQYVRRHYEISPANDGAGRVTLYFTQRDFNEFNAVNTTYLPGNFNDDNGVANLRIEKRNGTSNDGTGLPDTYTGTVSTIDPVDTDIVWKSSLNRWEVSFDVTGFSGFFVKSSDIPLPVTLASFEAVKDETTVLLNWKTATEVNSEHFDIERSTDGKNWKAIGKVAAMNNSQALQPYFFRDVAPRSGENLYRLKMVDLDGTFAYSRLRSVTFEAPDEVVLYPNPAAGPVQARVSPRYIGTQATLIDGSGKVLRTFKVTAENFQLRIKTSGMYLLRMYDGKAVVSYKL